MSMIDDLLASVMQREQPLQSAVPPVDQSTSVDPLTVTANRRPPAGPQVQMVPQRDVGPLAPPLQMPDFGTPQTPQSGPSLNYDNSADIQAVHQAMSPQNMEAGMSNPGLYGILPHSMQHGTVRNLLGALGDAMLVTSGRNATFQPYKDQLALGNAMAGVDLSNPDSVRAAMSRIGATGAAGASELEDKVGTQAEQAALRQQYMQYNQNYHEQIIGERNQNLIRQAAPQMQYYLSQAKDAADYAQRLKYVQSRIGAIDPQADATAELGVPPAEEWKPGMLAQLGMTSNQGQESADRGAARDVSQSNNAATNASRITAAQIAAASRVQAALTSAGRTTDATIMAGLIDKQQRGEALSPAEQQFWDHNTQVSTHSRRPATSGGGPGGLRGANGVSSGGPPIMTPQQAAQAPKGTVFRTTDGRTLVR